MAPQSGVSPQQELSIQKQWAEIEKKQNNIKMKWFHKNYERILATINPQTKGPKKTEKMVEELKKMRKIRFANERKERRKFQRNKECLPPYDGEEIDPEELVSEGPMLPVPEDILWELYHGISHNDEGRKRYLKLRNKYPLEEKFYEPITTYHEYGWDIQNRFSPGIRYGRKSVIKGSFHRRAGSLKFDSPLWREVLLTNPKTPFF